MSMYLEKYLNAAEMHRWTPQTFLSYTLRGRAKRYGARYHRALMNAIERELSAGRVRPVPSRGGGTAYIEVIE